MSEIKYYYYYYYYLSDIPISPVHQPAKVDLLIGQNNSKALVPRQVLMGNPGDPFTVLTKFGYSLNGVVPGSFPDCVSLAVVSNFVHTSFDAKVKAALDYVDSTLKSSCLLIIRLWISAMGSLLLLMVVLMFPSLGKLVMFTMICP